jgi:hypothetical protein
LATRAHRNEDLMREMGLLAAKESLRAATASAAPATGKPPRRKRARAQPTEPTRKSRRGRGEQPEYIGGE